MGEGRGTAPPTDDHPQRAPPEKREEEAGWGGEEDETSPRSMASSSCSQTPPRVDEGLPSLLPAPDEAVRALPLATGAVVVCEEERGAVVAGGAEAERAEGDEDGVGRDPESEVASLLPGEVERTGVATSPVERGASGMSMRVGRCCCWFEKEVRRAWWKASRNSGVSREEDEVLESGERARPWKALREAERAEVVGEVAAAGEEERGIGGGRTSDWEPERERVRLWFARRGGVVAMVRVLLEGDGEVRRGSCGVGERR